MKYVRPSVRISHALLLVITSRRKHHDMARSKKHHFMHAADPGNQSKTISEHASLAHAQHAGSRERRNAIKGQFTPAAKHNRKARPLQIRPAHAHTQYTRGSNLMAACTTPLFCVGKFVLRLALIPIKAEQTMRSRRRRRKFALHEALTHPGRRLHVSDAAGGRAAGRRLICVYTCVCVRKFKYHTYAHAEYYSGGFNTRTGGRAARHAMLYLCAWIIHELSAFVYIYIYVRERERVRCILASS